MSHFSFRHGCPALVALLAAVLLSTTFTAAIAQDAGPNPTIMRISEGTQRMEMVVNTSRILTLEEKIPRAQVNNPEILELTPLSPTQVQIFAKKAGVTQVNLWDQQNRVRSVDVIVFGDARELSMLLQNQFPTASLKVVPLANSVVVSGYVDRPEQVSRVIRIAEDYYPKVINNINVGGVQQVLLHVKVMEVSRTKLRAMGFDFSITNGSDFLISSVSGLLSSAGTPLGGDTIRFGIVDNNTNFLGVLEALRQNNVTKILAEPTLVTVSGRPANFTVGGEFPILVPAGLGTVSIEYKTFGTQVDFVPLVLGDGRIRLEVRPRVSELDESRGVTLNNATIPALSVRQVDTGVEMRAGQTLALAGLVQNRIEAENRGLPIVSDLPYIGAPFRRVEERNNEIELLILVTPELVDAMDAHEVPPLGPGMHTVSPPDGDLYWRGHLEVPNRRSPHGGRGPGQCYPQQQIPYGPPVEEIHPVPPTPQPVPDQARVRPGASRNVGTSPHAYAKLYKAMQGSRKPKPAPRPAAASSRETAKAGKQPVATQKGRGPVAPVRWTTSAAQNPQNRTNVSSEPVSKAVNRETSYPGFIGPVGYDVHQ
jgi:pilus assembly protein CpaC